MKYFVYVLRSGKDNKLYVGMTKNLEQRLHDHNQGKVSSTKSRVPLEIVYFEELPNSYEARLREKHFKSGAGREEIKRIVSK